MPEQMDVRVQRVCEAFRALDMATIMSCFSEQVVVNYNDLPRLSGRLELHEFLAPRYAKISNYELNKNVVLSSGNMVCVEVKASYTDRHSGINYRSTILEVLHFEGELISQWDYVGYTQATDSCH